MLNFESYLKKKKSVIFNKVTLQYSSKLCLDFSKDSPSLEMADLFWVWYNIPISFLEFF